MARDLRDALFTRIQTFSFANLDEQKTGQLMVRLTSDANAVQRVVLISLRIGTRAPLLMIGSLILMVSTSPSLALAMLPLLLVTSAIIVFFVIRMEPLFRSVQQKLDGLNTVLQENIAGARLVKSFVRADFEGERFEAANEAYTGQSVRVLQIMSTMSPVLTMCVNIGMVIVIWAGGIQSIQGDLSVGQIVAFTNYLLTTMTPLIMMTILSNIWAGGIASARRVNEVLDTVPDVRDAPDAIALPEPARGQAGLRKRLLPLQRRACRIRPGGDRPDHRAGSDRRLPRDRPARENRRWSTSCRASTMSPPDGSCSTGSTSAGSSRIRSWPGSGSCRRRRCSSPGRCGTTSATASPAQATRRSSRRPRRPRPTTSSWRFPRGMTPMSKSAATNLSGGQKQRIAIARALLMRPTILILDDSTSSVDVETETRIQEALETRMRRHTTLVVAQRISTVLKADKIVVLEKGRIAAEGTHGELIAASPIYREIFESQLGNDFDPEETAANGAREGSHMRLPRQAASPAISAPRCSRARRGCGRRSKRPATRATP